MAKALVTEREVRAAAREGRKTMDVAGSVVTPAARDLAGTLGVALVGDARRGRGMAPERRGAPPKAESTRARPAPSNQSPAPAGAPPPATGSKPLIAIGADHGGVVMKTAVAAHLRTNGFTVNDLGTNSADPVDYPDFAIAVAREVASKTAGIGIMIDGAGIGSCMAANKVPGVRAAMCYDVTTASNAREHNGANMLTLGGGLLGMRLALAIVDTFLATPSATGRHAKRVEKIDALDKRG